MLQRVDVLQELHKVKVVLMSPWQHTQTSAVPDQAVVAVNLGDQGPSSTSEAVVFPDLTTKNQYIVCDVVSSDRENEIDDALGEGRFYTTNKRPFKSLGEYQKAIEYHKNRLKTAIEIGDQAGEERAYETLSNSYHLLGDHRKSVEYHNKHLKIAIESGDWGGQGAAYGNLGIAYSSMGDYRKSIEYLEKHLKIAIEIGDRGVEGNAYGNLGISYRRLGDYQKSIEYLEKGLKIAIEIGDRDGEGKAYGNLGISYQRLGDYQKSIEYLEKGLKIAIEIGDRGGEGNAYGNLGISYRRLGDYQKSIEYLEKGLKIAIEIGDRDGEGNAYGNLGNSYQRLGDYQKSIEYLEKGLKIATEIGDRDREGKAYGNLGTSYQRLGDYQKSIEYLEKHLKIATEIGDRDGEGNAYGNLGTSYLGLGDYQKSIEYLEKRLKIATEIGDRDGEGAAYGNLGVAYSSMGDYRKSIEFLEKRLKIATEIGDRGGEGAAYGNLGVAYSSMGDYRKSIEYHEKSLKIAIEIGDRDGEGKAYGNLGYPYRRLGDYRKSIEYLEKGLKIAIEIGDRQREGEAYGSLEIPYSSLGDHRKCIEYLEKRLKIAIEIGDRGGEGNAYGNLGNSYQRLGDYQKSIEYLEKGLKIAIEIGDRDGEGNAYGNLGISYKRLGDYQKSIEYLEKGLKIAIEIGDRDREGKAYGNLGISYQRLGDYQKSIEYLEKGLKIAIEIGDRDGEGNTYQNLGYSYQRLGDYQKSIEYLEKGLKIAIEIGDRDREGKAYGNLGISYQRLGDYQKSIEYLEKGLKIAIEIGDRGGEGNTFGNLGIAYRSLGDYRKSIKYLEKGLKIAIEIGDRGGEGKAYRNLGTSYQGLGDYQKSIEYLEKGLKIAEEIGDRGGEGAAYGNLGIAYSSLGSRGKRLLYPEVTTAPKRQSQNTGIPENTDYSCNSDFDESESFKPGTISRDDVRLIARELGPSWKTVGRMLNVPDSAIDQIEADEFEIFDKCYSLVRYWREMYATDASYRRLARALQHPIVDRVDLAVKYCGLQLGKDVAAAGKDAGSSVPAEIRGRGPEAERAFQKAMESGKVKVYRGRIMLLGQDRAGKTSLKKSLLGLPFDPEEESTVGVEVDWSKCELDVDKVQNWMPSKRSSEFEEELARLIVMDLRGTKANDNDSTATDSDVVEVKITDEQEERKYYEEPKLLSDVDEPGSDTKEKSMIVEDGQKAFSEQKPVDKNDNSTTLPKDVTDLIANDVTELVVRYLQSLQLEDDIKSEEVTLTLWDFAGQHLYYASHSVFLSGRAVYILVYNLNKNLLETAEPCVRQGVHKLRLDNANNETNLDNLLSWLVSVHNIRSATKENVAHRGKKLSYLQPPVIIVGTNLDQPFEEVSTMEQHIKESLEYKEYEQHVTAPFFAVDNKTENDEGVQKLRQRIIEILKNEPYMGEEVPLRWFKFERAVDALVAKQTYFMDLDQLLSVIRQVCQIEDEEEVTAMLNFYHDLGVIVKHGQTVVLQAQWLIDLFRQLITVPPFDETDPKHRKWWRDLEVNGILSIALVDHVFSKFMDKGLCKQDILDLMERHGLIAKFSIATDKNQDEQRYFVPTQLRSSPSGLWEIKPSGCDPCPLVLHFLDGFVPHGLFPQLVSKFIHWCSENRLKETPQLFNNGARLFIGKQITFALILICRKRFIKIVLKTRNPSSCKSQSMIASNKMAIEVRNFIERTLDDFSRDLSWLSNLRYELSVVCTYCLECTCHLHERTSCDQDDCLHLLRVRPGEELICLKNFCDETVSPGWEMWFEVPHTQTMEPEGDTQIADGYSSIVPPKRKKGVEENESAHPAGHSSRAPPKRKKGIAENESAHPADPNEVESLDSRTLSEDDVLLIAYELGPSREMVGRVLNVPDAVVDQIEANKSKDSEKCYSILRHWQEMYRSDATYHALACALQNPAVARVDLAVKYCGLQLGKDVAVVSKPLKDLVNDASDSLEEICKRLDTQLAGLGYYEDVAKYYDYDVFTIKARFKRSPDGPSKALILAIIAEYPDVTVESFAEVVVKQTRREDVARLLREFDCKW
ncbi:uncharacterized protein [Acropora muricata]|uniref:uncharacterized protein isoform X12 n=1 Tax=Acropora muricata TaxID=159855 RepID=UPI0034E61699